MRLKINAKGGPVIGTHVGQGEDRRMLFVTPWGCALSTPPKAPEGSDLSKRAYEVDASGECARLIVQAIREAGHSLSDRVEIVSEKAIEPGAPQLPVKKSRDPEPKL